MRQGFTLIELLIVIVIVAILSAVAVPIFNSVKERANSSRSAANLRSIGTALAGYQTDNDGRFPAVRSNDRQISQLANWVSELVVLLNSDADVSELEQAPPTKMFVSPSIAWETAGAGIYEIDELLYTYAATDSLVGFDYDDNPDPTQGRRVSLIEKRAESILVVEAAQEGTEPHSYAWIEWSTASSDLSKGADGQRVDFRYRDRLNVLLGDYSVTTFGEEDATEIVEWQWKGYDYPENY